MRHWVTLTKGQGHSLYLKVKKYHFLITLDNLSDIIFLKYSYETWPTGNLWGDLQNDVTLGDLDQGQGHSFYLIVRR